MAKRHGWPEELLKDLANFRNRPEFTDAEKAALELAERETIDAHTVDDELWARLKQHYDDGQIIELCAAIGVFNYFNRFNDALRMEPTK